MALPYIVNRIPGQPIIFGRLTATFTLNDYATYFAEIAELAAEFEGTYYRIVDVSEVGIDLDTLVRAMEDMATDTPGSVFDPRVGKNFCIGSEDQARVLRGLLEQSLSLTFPIIIVDSLAQALNTIYTELEENGKDSDSDS